VTPGALASWQFWALASAAFAALTAIFAKVGIENVNSDFATFIRTIVILLCLAAILIATGQRRRKLPPHLRLTLNTPRSAARRPR
jgi:uncharacterized membrane protein